MVLPCACHPGRPVGKPGREADRRLGRRSPAGSKTAAPAGAFVRAGSIRPLKTGRAAGGRRECPAAYEGIFFFHEKNIPSRSPGRTAGRDGAVAGFASPGAAFDAFPPALPRLPPSPLERRRGRERLRPPQRRMRPAKRGGSGQNSGNNRPQRMVDAPPPTVPGKPRASPAGSCGPSLGIRSGGWAREAGCGGTGGSGSPRRFASRNDGGKGNPRDPPDSAEAQGQPPVKSGFCRQVGAVPKAWPPPAKRRRRSGRRSQHGIGDWSERHSVRAPARNPLF